MKKLAFVFTTLILVSCGGNNDNKVDKIHDIPLAPERQVSEMLPETENVSKPVPKVDSHTAKPDKSAEDELMDLVLNLPEIRKQDEAMRKKTDGKRGLKSFIKDRPSDDNEYYAVGVGEDNGSSLVTLYTFHVYPDNTIMVYDPVSDEEISLKKWSRKN